MVVLHGPATFVAHSKVVPTPQPVAEIVPTVEGQTLLVIVIVGAPGLVQIPGTVEIAAKLGLAVVPSKSHKHLVSIL